MKLKISDKKKIINYYKNFVDGIQNVILDQITYQPIEIQKTYYWQELGIYNKLLYIKQLSNKFNEEAIYGPNGLVSKLVNLQLTYNKIMNIKNMYLINCFYPTLYIEDGSVDIDNLEEEGLSPGKIIVYRQGSNPPKINDFIFSKDLVDSYNNELSIIENQINSIIMEFKQEIKDETN